MNAPVVPEPDDLGPGASGPAESSRGSRPRRLRIVVLGVLLLAALGGLTVVRLQLLDPYRPGTVHHETTSLDACDVPGALRLNDRVWESHDRLPSAWLDASTAPDIGGTFEVTATDEATFTADIGGTVHFHRLPPNGFGLGNCPIK